MNGILLINKEKEYTSQDVVSCVKKILKIKKAGHTGTLDPMATGVLPILLGDATKLSKYLIEHDKEYEAIIKLGIKKDTADSEGKTIEEKEVLLENLEKNKIIEVLNSFLGETYQIPPMYSSIKINGKKLYEYAREGIEVERPKRKINIYNIELLNLNKEDKTIKIKVECSKGTYIRTLCEDIAEKLETVGYMKELNRTKVDNFQIQNTVTLEKLEENKENKIISIEEYYTNYNFIEEIVLDDKKIKLFLNGSKLTINKKDGLFRIYCNKEFIGLGTILNKNLKRDIVII